MKNITQHNLDEWLFEYFEGNLNEDDSNRLLQEIGNNPEFAEDFNYWKHSYLKDYPSVQYSSPEKLKRKPLGKMYWIGAGMLLLAGLFLFYTYSSKDVSHNNSLIIPTNSQKNTSAKTEVNEVLKEKIISDIPRKTEGN